MKEIPQLCLTVVSKIMTDAENFLTDSIPENLIDKSAEYYDWQIVLKIMTDISPENCEWQKSWKSWLIIFLKIKQYNENKQFVQSKYSFRLYIKKTLNTDGSWWGDDYMYVKGNNFRYIL